MARTEPNCVDGFVDVMDRPRRYCSILRDDRNDDMITLILEEDQVLSEGQEVSDLGAFLKGLPLSTELTVLIKSHDATYYICPLKKAAPYMRSAEYSSDSWVGEKVLSKGKVLLGGILPTPFIRDMIHLLSNHSFAIRGVYLWAELIVQAYAPLTEGWTLILHGEDLFVCQDGILRFSRHCFQPLAQELPMILRYIKRYGYEKEAPILLLTEWFTDSLPSFIHLERRAPIPLPTEGIRLRIPELDQFYGLYSRPRVIRKVAYGLSLFCWIGAALLNWHSISLTGQQQFLHQEIEKIPTKDSLDGANLEAFSCFQRLANNRSDFLILLRQLIPLVKNQAVATRLNWVPDSLTLHLELSPLAQQEELWRILKAQFITHNIKWSPQEDEPLKGVLVLEKSDQQTMGQS